VNGIPAAEPTSGPQVTVAPLARPRPALAGAGVDWARVTDYRTLAGGTFNDVYLVTLSGDARLVITGPGSGYPERPFGPMRVSWREAFLAMVNAVLADAVRFAVIFPRNGNASRFTAPTST
jgi:hypothetical protein